MDEARKRALERNKIKFSKGLNGIAADEMPVIVLRHVSKDYESRSNGEMHSLRDVSLSISKGEFVFVIGNSGAGKSTLLRLLMKEIDTTSGDIYVNSKRLGRLRRSQVARYRRGIGMVFQDFRLLKDRTVFENVAFAEEVIGESRDVIKTKVPEMLALVGLTGKEKAYPKELSGGEQQRVALARALINNPVILLADEPTGNLDPRNSIEIMNLLEQVNRRGTTVVVVTHNQDIVNQMQKRVITIESGRIISDKKKGGYNEYPDTGQEY